MAPDSVNREEIGIEAGLEEEWDTELQSEMDQTLAVSYQDSYIRTGNMEDLETALKYNLFAVAATPEGHRDLAKRHQSLALSYTHRYQRMGNVEDLEAALKYNLLAVAATPEGHPGLAEKHGSLAISYSDRYQRIWNVEDLEAAHKYNLLAVAATPEGHPGLAERHRSLAISYTDKYQRTGNVEDLEAALRYNRLAVAATPEGHPDLAKRHRSLAISYTDRYQRIGDMEDLATALKYNLLAVAATPEGHPGLAERNQSLAISYIDRYRRIGNVEDLETALKYNLLAVAATPEGYPGMAERHQSLAISYRDRYQKFGDVEDLKAALKYNLLAVAETPEGHPGLAERHKSLAISYSDRYRRIGDVEDLDTTLKYNLLAVDATPEGHPVLAGRHQSLAISYSDRYQRIGNVEDLEAALKYNLLAVAATPEGYPGMAERHQSLAISYRDRYQKFGDVEDLEAALKYNLLAVAETPEGHPDLAERHQILAISYSDRYRRIGNMEDLEAALKYKLLAVAATPEGHPDLAQRHRSLAISYSDKYLRIGNVEDLETALKYKLLAVAATPGDHPDLAERHQSLAISYSDRYRRIGNVEDLEAALKYDLLAVAATPEDHPDLAARHHSLAISYTARYTMTSDLEDLHNANSLYNSALTSLNTPPQDLWSICTEFTVHAQIFPPHDIMQAYTTAFTCLPSLLWLGNSLNIRHDAMIRNNISTLMSKAVAFALQTSHSTLAVEFLEQGLFVTHKQNLQLRDLHENLQAYFPTLFERFYLVSVQLQGSFYQSDPTLNYHALAHERQQLITHIRTQPGFEDFLLPPKYSHLCMAAKSGPVIMLNHTATLTDIIIIVKPGVPPFHIPLPGVQEIDIHYHQQTLKNALKKLNIYSRNKRAGNSTEMQENLKSAMDLLTIVTDWLWTSVVKPVFDVLAENGIQDGRLWWCPSGPFTYLPLHAAAPIWSRFIQSYIPTLNILIHANSKQASASGNNLLTAVGVSQTLVTPPNSVWPNIPSVDQEVKTVVKLFGDQSQQLQGPRASITLVIEAIQSSSWLHLACHGEQVSGDPLQSGLILHNEKLSLSQILKLDLPNAKFAYLSACETAMGDQDLANEAMHLAGGFLSAGFQGAVGTLWSMSDRDGPRVAGKVYKTILGKDNMPDVQRAAEGLHLAIQKLRRAGVPQYRWMPFVHFGV